MNKSVHDEGNDDDLMFSNDDEEGVQLESKPAWKIMVVDDDADMIAVTRMVFSSFRFQDRPIHIIAALNAAEAIERLKEDNDIAVAYIDVVMETDHAGLDLVEYIRGTLKNHEIQLVLRTGQPGYAPEMKVILEYEINDYRTKTDMDSIKLMTTLVSSLRNYTNIVTAKERAQLIELTEEVSRTKNLFFAQMSHDFRTPLNSILGFCQLLKESALTEEQLEQVELVEQSGEHLLKLVNDILELSKSEAGKLKLDVAAFALSDALLQVCKSMSPQVNPGVVFEYDIPEGLPAFVRGDAFRFQQVLNNLLSNALKFTKYGRVSLAVSVLPSTEKEWMIEFQIKDTGVGIAENAIDKLFSVYEQANSLVAKRFGGTGLGLSICKNLIQMMDGDIQVESSIGQGSVFTFTAKFLRDDTSDETFRHNQELENGFEQALTAIHGARFLVVDDDASSRLLLRKMLESKGALIELAENGQQALSMAAEHPFDIVLTDCELGDIDGFELARRLKNLEGFKSVPVIAISGVDIDEQWERCRDSGVVECIQKPIKLEQLAITVGTVIANANKAN